MSLLFACTVQLRCDATASRQRPLASGLSPAASRQRWRHVESLNLSHRKQELRGYQP